MFHLFDDCGAERTARGAERTARLNPSRTARRAEWTGHAVKAEPPEARKGWPTRSKSKRPPRGMDGPRGQSRTARRAERMGHAAKAEPPAARNGRPASTQAEPPAARQRAKTGGGTGPFAARSGRFGRFACGIISARFRAAASGTRPSRSARRRRSPRARPARRAFRPHRRRAGRGR